MRWALIYPILVLAGCAALAAAVSLGRADTGSPPVARAPRNGMELLEAYRCGIAETKRVIVRGVEDNFSPAGDEPSIVRKGRRSARWVSFTSGGGYDQSQPDRVFTDSLMAPTPAARGLFVIGLRAITGNGNDVIAIRDQTADALGSLAQAGFNHTVVSVEQLPGWRRTGNVYSAELSDMPYKSADGTTDTLLAQLRHPGGDWIDVLVQDDTSVDFIGLAVCIAPTARRGITLAAYYREEASGPRLTSLSCQWVKDSDKVCDPYRGDTPCGTPLPIACLRPREAAQPAMSDANDWTGGDIALTAPAPASRFKRISDVDRFCAASFGPRWRTAALHDGLTAGGMIGYAAGPPPRSRVWIDIVDQPYGTCWTR